MYKLNGNIRIRRVDDQVFIVNIRNNNIFSIKKEAMDFLLDAINKNSIEHLIIHNNNFAKFVDELLKSAIIEVI